MAVAQELTVEWFAGVTDDQRVMLLRGPLTLQTSPHFQRALRNEGAATVIVDLANVPYIDSVGLGSLVSAQVSTQKSGRCLVLAGVNKKVGTVMDITNVRQLFVTFPTTWQAVEAMASTGTA